MSQSRHQARSSPSFTPENVHSTHTAGGYWQVKHVASNRVLFRMRTHHRLTAACFVFSLLSVHWLACHGGIQAEWGPSMLRPVQGKESSRTSSVKVMYVGCQFRKVQHVSEWREGHVDRGQRQAINGIHFAVDLEGLRWIIPSSQSSQSLPRVLHGKISVPPWCLQSPVPAAR